MKSTGSSPARDRSRSAPRAALGRFGPAAWLAVGLLGCAESGGGPGATGRESRLHASGATRAPRADLQRDLEALWPERDRRHVLIRLARAPSGHDRRRLGELGVQVHERRTGDSYWATLERGSAPPRADQLVGIDALRSPRIDEKLHPTLLRVPVSPGRQVPAADNADATEVLYVQLFPDEAVVLGEPRPLGLRGADVLGRAPSVDVLVVRGTPARAQALAGDDRVRWVEPALPPLGPLSLVPARPNDRGRASTQADQLHGAPYFLDGSGVRVLLFDGGMPRVSHVDFGGRVRAREPLRQGFHATHVAGILGGSGAGSSGLYTGHAPAVLVDAYGLEFRGPVGVLFYADPGDIEADYRSAIRDHGVVLSTNSLGLNVDINGYPCNLLGDYGVTSALIDGIVHGELGQPFRIVWSAGNERAQTFFDENGDVIFLEARCPAAEEGYGTISPPAGAKNPLCVGAVNSSDESMTVFSSWGPTDDGRLKPDVVAPGCDVAGGGIVSTFSRHDADYAALCGTSMSAPAAAGCAALLIQALESGFGLGPPLNSTLKALLIHGAADLEAPGPDHETGYGALRIRDTVDALGAGRFLEERLELPDESRSYVVDVGASDDELKITLVWDDPPRVPGVFGALVNDLELDVRDSAGRRHFPWTLDPSRPGEAAVRTRTDHVNNVEQVLVSDPVPGAWRVAVHAADAPELPQAFSLVSSHPLEAGPGVELTLTDPLPVVVLPSGTVPLRVRARALGGEVLAGLPTVHHRRGPGERFRRSVLHADSSGEFVGTIPGPSCGAPLELYVAARGARSRLVTLPPGAPERVFTVVASRLEAVFADDFEEDRGWTVTSGSGLTSGRWQRAIPRLLGENAPLSDHDGSGRCFVTDNRPFEDVDGSFTRLESPPIDAVGERVIVSFAVWFANDDADEDRLRVTLTSDGGATWTEVASFQNTGGWRVHSFELDEPGARVAFRFTVADDPDDSITEAAVDRFRVERLVCNSE